MARNANVVGFGITIVVAIIIAFLIATFVAMIVFGNVAGYTGWHSPGFWETFNGLFAVSIIGGWFNTSKISTGIKK